MLEEINDDARIKNDSNDEAEEEYKYECSQCGDTLTGSYWYCYYSGDSEDNRVCGEGNCWADWIQYHMEEVVMDWEDE